MKVLDIKRNDAEPVLMEKAEQFVGMFLDAGELDFGLKRSRIVRHIYEPGDLFIFPRHRPMFLRGIGANFMLVGISDAALKFHDDRDVEIRVRCQEHLDDRRIQGLMMALNAEKQAGFPSGPMFLESIELLCRQHFGKVMWLCPIKFMNSEEDLLRFGYDESLN